MTSARHDRLGGGAASSWTTPYRLAFGSACLLAPAVALWLFASPLGFAQSRSAGPTVPAAAAPAQSVLGPGAYIFQTRVRNASCQDDSRTGHVRTFFAAVDGIPNARTLQMSLLNSRYWPRWSLTVTENDDVVGEAEVARRDNRPPDASSSFEVSLERGRFSGHGSRIYMKTVDGQRRRCRVTFDALLRRLDD